MTDKPFEHEILLQTDSSCLFSGSEKRKCELIVSSACLITSAICTKVNFTYKEKPSF